jgi:hypothetical protein
VCRGGGAPATAAEAPNLESLRPATAEDNLIAEFTIELG